MRVREVLVNPLSWAVACCVAAVASTFLVWDVVPVMGLRLPLTGFGQWPGKTVAAAAVGLALVLLATYNTGRPAAWHAPAVGLAGAGLLGFAVWYQSNAGGHRDTTETAQVSPAGREPHVTTRPVTVAPGDGLYAVEGVGVVLLVVGVLLYRRRVQTPNPDKVFQVKRKTNPRTAHRGSDQRVRSGAERSRRPNGLWRSIASVSARNGRDDRPATAPNTDSDSRGHGPHSVPVAAGLHLRRPVPMLLRSPRTGHSKRLAHREAMSRLVRRPA